MRSKYESVMGAVARKYGSEHRKQLFYMELQNRRQRSGESLQEYAADIERLVHLAHYDVGADLMEQMKIRAFIQGIRDVEVRRSVLLVSKPTFTETVAHALTYEAAWTGVTHYVSPKVRKVEFSCEEEQSASDYSSRKPRAASFKGSCYVCDKPGHMARDCRLRWKRTKSLSPVDNERRRERMVEQKPSLN